MACSSLSDDRVVVVGLHRAPAAGRKDQAAAYLAQAEALATHDPLPLAMHHAHAGQDAARALALAEATLAERDTVYTQAAHALALLRNGRIDEAGKAMERALRLGTPWSRRPAARNRRQLVIAGALRVLVSAAWARRGQSRHPPTTDERDIEISSRPCRPPCPPVATT